jgi:hypothetical protein
MWDNNRWRDAVRSHGAGEVRLKSVSGVRTPDGEKFHLPITFGARTSRSPKQSQYGLREG